MKFFVIFIIAATTSLWSRAQSVEGIVFDTQEHNFGTIKEEGGIVEHTFEYKNSSDEPFVIIDVLSSCGCTAPRYSTAPLAAGERESLTIAFNPDGYPGRIDKSVRVISNQGTILLHVDGVVEARPRSLTERFPFAIGSGARLSELGRAWLHVPKGDTIIVTIPVANANMTIPINISVEPSSLSPGVQVLPYDNLLGANSILPLRFVLRGEDFGSFSHSIRLAVNGVVRAEKIILAGATVDNFRGFGEEEIASSAHAEFSSFHFSLGEVEINKAHRVDVRITNRGESPLIIRAVEPSSMVKYGGTVPVSIEPGGAHTMTLHYTPTIEGYDSANVKVLLNDPSAPVREIRITATVR